MREREGGSRDYSALGSPPPFGDRLRQRQGAPRGLDMQRLDEPSLVADRALPGGDPLRIGGNETAGPRDLVRLGAKAALAGSICVG